MLGSYSVQIRTPETLVYSDPEGRFSVWQHQIDVGGKWLTFVHSYVQQWDKTTYRAMRTSFDALRVQFPSVIACMPYEPSTKFDKFITSYGFFRSGSAPCSDGTLRPLYFHYI